MFLSPDPGLDHWAQVVVCSDLVSSCVESRVFRARGHGVGFVCACISDVGIADVRDKASLTYGMVCYLPNRYVDFCSSCPLFDKMPSRF